ncbi:c-type cytochrome [Marivirga sp. S37H4]|uniref:C-type cytochrome n=1 Tax=Marivirga aurantiaca TaxID=2802615 RepID=A0A934X204_9BACT|nr:cbb3-type cytochrome c oxidase N-terminal domain-containing protein [Marivirga aurantiaca]MBK6266855.1 c-type cytochrome [Marivirga aurantiaca]
MNNILKRMLLVLPIFLIGSVGLYAQTEEAVEILEPKSMIATLMESEQGRLLLIIGALVIVLILLMVVLTSLMLKTANIILNKKAVEKGVERPSFFEQFKQKWVTGKLKPVEEQGDMMLDHNYDGIREMDYGMPPWLKYVFIGTFLFAVFYVPAYLIFDIIPNQTTEYEAQIEEAALRAEVRAKAGLMSITAETAKLETDEAVIAAGKQIYMANCAVCHAADGGGGVGPNLTDEYWIHGEDIKGVFTTVYEGVPAKGMIPWKGNLNPKQIQDVSNYVLSLVGRPAAAPKEPQGELKPRQVNPQGEEEKVEKAEERIDEAVEKLPDSLQENE